MTEEEVFLAVLDLPGPAERKAYLDEVCAGNPALRQQVESLLAAHFKTGAFLDESAADQIGAELAVSIRDYAESQRANSRGDLPEEGSDDLSFLQPSSRPGSLGRIGQYEVLEVLGKGGFGIVFRALDDVLQRVVALKVLAPAIASSSPARKRFLREARSSAQVRHENVVQVYAVEERPLPYLAMEFIPGETLQQRLDRAGPLEPAEIVRLGRQIAEGLAAAHATGLIHRDIKPGNVLIEGAGHRVKISDFGLARAADDASLTQSGVLAGTPMYMAPEQATGDALDHRADLFSLGSVLYVMVTGRPPFRASTTYAVLKRVVEDDPRPIREIIPETPQWLCNIIARLQKKKPDERFQSAREVADVLAECEVRLRVNPQLPDFPAIRSGEVATSRTGRWKWVAVAALGLSVLAVALVLMARNPRGLTSQQRTLDVRTRPEGSTAVRGHPEDHGSSSDFVNTLGMEFKLIPAGKFMMGSSPEEIERAIGMSSHDDVLKQMLESERPAHEVEITRSFYMGATEVTVGQFRQFINANPTYGVGDDRWKTPGFVQSVNDPVVWISWQNAVDFCDWLSRRESKTYRLPTEAEWEYCCRAGKSGTRYGCGDDDAQLENYAWFDYRSGNGTHPVREKMPNAWGLYDMHGNVFEFCQDLHDLNAYKNNSAQDPIGLVGSSRVTRGGGWNYQAVFCRAAFRSWLEPQERRDCIGFRAVLVAPQGGSRTANGK